MSHAETCPVCQGTGRVSVAGTHTIGRAQPCHGCGGTGWVTVQDELPRRYRGFLKRKGACRDKDSAD